MNILKPVLNIFLFLTFALLTGEDGKTITESIGLKEHLKTKEKILMTLKINLPRKFTHLAKELSETIMREASRNKIDPLMITAVISGESSFNPSAIGPIGEIGLMQLRPATAKWIARKTKADWKGRESLKKPIYNIQIGSAYLGYLKKRFSPQGGHLYLAAYNMGVSTLLRLLSNKIQPNIYELHIMKNYIAINK